MGAGDEGDEGDESHEGHEEGHEAQGNEKGRRGGTDEGDEGHESYEGYEEGHEGDEEVKRLGVQVLSMLLVGNGHEQCLVASSRGGVPRLGRLYKGLLRISFKT